MISALKKLQTKLASSRLTEYRLFNYLSKKTQAPQTNESLVLDYPECLHEEFGELYEMARQTTSLLIQKSKDIDFSELAKHSPGLKGFDWSTYLSCSLMRLLKVAQAVKNIGENKKILDYGSYFGNFTLLLNQMGHDVDAIDSYNSYNGIFDFVLDEFREKKIQTYDFDKVGYDLNGTQKQQYDIIICCGVIEHIPHTPRLLFEAFEHALKPKGHLILETPNLAYVYNRQKLMDGLSIHCPIEQQYTTEIPFEGHHREYTQKEIIWLLNQNRYSNINVELFFYSIYGLSELAGIDLQNYHTMLDNPSYREIILATAQRNV